MNIMLSPIRWAKSLSVTKSGETLIVNNTSLDFSGVPEGGSLSNEDINCSFIVGDVGRVNDDLQLTILLPISATAGESARFPQPIINPADGSIDLPE